MAKHRNTIDLHVAADHVESIAKCMHPIRGIEELVWNALDADAKQVSVDFS